MTKTHRGAEQRVFWATALALAAISLAGWLRFQQALRHWYYLIEIGLWPPPIYLAATGGLIGIAYSLGLIFHLTKQPFTTLILHIISAALILWLWADRVFLCTPASFTLLLAGTVFVTIGLIALDQFVFKRNTYSTKEGANAPEN